MDEKEELLWGGVFSQLPEDDFFLFSSSIEEDKILYKYELELSEAHAKILTKINIISKEELARIIEGIRAIKKDIEEGNFEFSYKKEDIHTHIELALKDKIGEIADKLHAGRSRNEQIATLLRMFLKDEVKEILSLLVNLMNQLLKIGEENKDLPMPSFTHLRAGEISLFSLWLLSHNAALQRDALRLIDIYPRLDMLPAGVAAGTFSSLNLDRNHLAALLNFSSILLNPVDAVGSRDFILEFIFCCLSLLLNLSRLCEELIIFSSPKNFSFIELPQKYSSGSSIMPHKINPDLPELIRARCGLILGYFVSLATILKGLPSNYQRDLQEDKRCLLPTVKLTKEILNIFPKFLEGIKINKEVLKAASSDFTLYTTELQNYLILKGLSYREAHRKVGELIKSMREKNLNEYTPQLLMETSSLFDEEEIKDLLTPQKVIEKKKLKEALERQINSSYNFIYSLEEWLKRS